MTSSLHNVSQSGSSRAGEVKAGVTIEAGLSDVRPRRAIACVRSGGPGDAAASLAVAAAAATDVRISLIRVNRATARERRMLPDAADNSRLLVRAVQSPGCERSIDCWLLYVLSYRN